jgi:hypothetical protein
MSKQAQGSTCLTLNLPFFLEADAKLVLGSGAGTKVQGRPRRGARRVVISAPLVATARAAPRAAHGVRCRSERRAWPLLRPVDGFHALPRGRGAAARVQ